MTLLRVEGDLIKMAKDGQFDYVVHGCNCFHKMKSGIAGLIAKEFPRSILADFSSPYGSKNKLGTWTEATVCDYSYNQFRIINAYTQFTYSRQADVFEYEAFDKFLVNFGNVLRERSKEKGRKLRVGLPKIGCGLAGGDERRIVAALEGFAGGLREDDSASVTLVTLPA